MEAKAIAFCGIDCSVCDAYLATQSGDPAELERVATAWRQLDPNVTANTLRCDGCLAVGGRLFSWCTECPIRTCARQHGVASCAYCAEYVCDRLAPHFEQNPKMRDILNAMRAEYLSSAA